MSITSDAPRSISRAWHKPNSWWVSPWNYEGEALADPFPDRPHEVFVVDSTLRSLCTSEPGSAVSPDDLVEIARGLDEIGVQEAVFNISHTGTISELAYKGARACIDADLKHMKITSGCVLRPGEWRSGLDIAWEAGIRQLEVSYGATPLEGFSGTPAVFDLLREAMDYARDLCPEVSVGLNIHRDTSFEFASEFVRIASEYSPRFLRIYDTKTCMGPHALEWLVRQLRARAGEAFPPFVIHTHNSWGLATATTIAGVLAGAAGVDVAMLAVGTKSGHAPLEEVVLALEALYGVKTGIDLDGLAGLAELVADVVRVPIHPSKPVVGANSYICEQGPAVAEALMERLTGKPSLTPFASEVVGRHKRIVWGKNTLKPYVMELKLQEIGVPTTPGNVSAGLDLISARLAELTEYPLWLEDSQVSDLLKSALGI